MKDPVDTVTQELVLPRRPGRPSLGARPMTAAERKRRQRDNDLLKIWGAPGVPRDCSSASSHVLAVELAKCVEQGFKGTAQLILDELSRRVDALSAK